MGKKDLSKDVLNIVKKKTGKQIAEKDIYKLASGVKPSTVQNEDQLRKLIKQVSEMANVPVAESTVNEIVQAVKQSGLNTTNMESIMKTILKK
ncbi:MAG: hypothetical protein A2189_03410 [Paenibacillus sp. RIFOXYA1_FULL_44_5]|nr:MAG: hypothetical protein A2189_03410 [Paenibacillus sp. RIFOXYA1_FULL_44_5]